MTGTARRLTHRSPHRPISHRPIYRLPALAALALALTSLAACADDAERAGGPTGAGATTSSAGTAATTVPTTSTPPTRPTTATRTARPAASRTGTATSPPRATPKPSPKPAPKPPPRPSPTPAPTPPSSGGVAGQVLALVNSQRSKAGCRAVRANSALQTAAQRHSADMAAKDYFSHTSKDGRTFADRIRAAGYRGSTIGENIAAGQSTASAVMRSWMASSGHRANILNCSFTALGVGHATGGSYGHYWTQDFGG